MKTMNKIRRILLTLITLCITTATWGHLVKFVTYTGATITVKNGNGITIATATGASAVTSSSEVTAGETVTLNVSTSDTYYLSSF